MMNQSIQKVMMGSRGFGASTKRFLGHSNNAVKMLGAGTKAINKLGYNSSTLNKINSFAQDKVKPLLEKAEGMV